MTCETCHFYRPNPEQLEKGECRRYPPTPKLVNGVYFPEFPPVYKDDWCGEYKANERDAPKPRRSTPYPAPSEEQD